MACRGHNGDMAVSKLVPLASILALLLYASFGIAQESPEPPFTPDEVELQPAEALQVLNTLCPGKTRPGKKNGCPPCQPETGRYAEGFTIESAIRGHFLGPHSDDLMVSTKGCEDHADGWGGHVLLTKQQGRWKVGMPYAPWPMGACMKMPHNGVDGLICFSSDRHGTSAGSGISFEFVGKPWVPLAYAYTDVAMCWYDARWPVFTESEILSLKVLHDVNGTLIIEERCHSGALNETARNACDRNAEYDGTDSIAAPFKTYRLKYAFRGDNFVLISSESEKRELDACTHR
jgi:hypothetical protein